MNRTHLHHHKEMIMSFRRRFWIALGLSFPVLILSVPFMNLLSLPAITFPGSTSIQFLFATVIFVYGGFPFLSGAYSELQTRTPGMMTLVALAITIAYGYSFAIFQGFSGNSLLWEVVTLIDVMLLGHWLEMRSVVNASRSLETLSELLPSTAHKISGNALLDVEISELIYGDTVRVKAGERIPTDGVILEGTSYVDEQVLTGEATPVSKQKGDSVIGGSVNTDGVLTVKVTQPENEGYVNQMIELVDQAQAQKTTVQRFADRAAFGLTILAITAGMLTFGVWFWGSDQSFAFVIERTIAVIVIACPHALGLAIPLVTAISTSMSAQNGMLIKNRTAFEHAHTTQAIVFDKTGTLTHGTFHVSTITSFTEQYTQSEILHLAASLEAHSEHPIGQAIAHEEPKVSSASSVQTIPGAGIQGTVNQKFLKAVSPQYIEEQNISLPESESVSADGKTLTYLLENNVVIGAITLEDSVREEAQTVVQQLQKAHKSVILLTGDQQTVAEHIANQLNITEVYAEISPDRKADTITQLKDRYPHVTMVGDGINDAPALARADLGIAIGSGTDIAAETADLILIQNNLHNVPRALTLSKQTHRKMMQNLWWAAGYNIVALPLAGGIGYTAGIVLSPAVGGLLMSASTVIVAVNAILLRKHSHL